MAVDQSTQSRGLIPRPQQMLTEVDEMQAIMAEEMERAGEDTAFEVKPPKLVIVSTMQLFANELTQDTFKVLEGVVLFSRENRALYENDEKIPVCSSWDGMTGVIRATSGTRRCRECPFNGWGSDPKGGKGKACKETRRLAIMLDADAPIPITLSIPPTSITEFDKYCSGLATSKPPMAYFGIITKLSLEKQINPGTNQVYSKVRFEKVGNLNLDQLRWIRSLRERFEAIVAVELTADDYSVMGSNEDAVNRERVTVGPEDVGSFNPDDDYAPPWDDDRR